MKVSYFGHTMEIGKKKTPNNTKKVRGWSHKRANIKPIIKIPSTGERRIKVCCKFSIPCVAPFVYKKLRAKRRKK